MRENELEIVGCEKDENKMRKKAYESNIIVCSLWSGVHFLQSHYNFSFCVRMQKSIVVYTLCDKAKTKWKTTPQKGISFVLAFTFLGFSI